MFVVLNLFRQNGVEGMVLFRFRGDITSDDCCVYEFPIKEIWI
jgi:hypothetical protein